MFGLQKAEICPTCLSRFRDVHGMIFAKDAESYQCFDTWHKGPEYDPNTLLLTLEDREFLKACEIGAK